jgi:hypothetical protein
MKDSRFTTKLIIVILCVVTIAIVMFNNSSKTNTSMDEILSKNKSNEYYDRILEKNPQDKKSVYGQIKKINNLIEDKQLYANIVESIGYSSSGANILNTSHKSIKEINEAFNKLSTYHMKKDYFDEYVILKSLYNWYVGNTEIAINTLKEYEFLNSEMKEIRDLHLSAMNIELANMNKAKEIIEMYNKDNKYEDYWKVINNYYLVMNNKVNEVRNNIAKQDIQLLKDNKLVLLPLNDLQECIRDLRLTSTHYEEPKDDSKDMKTGNKSLNLKREKTNNIVKGKVLFKGKPCENAIIYLTNQTGMCSHFGYIFESNITALTNDKGEYIIENVPKGNYSIGIAITWQRIKGNNIVFEDNKDYLDIVMNDNNQYTRNINIYSPLEVTADKLSTNKYKLIINHPQLEFDYYTIGLSYIYGDEEPCNSYYYSDRIYSKDNEIVIDINEEKNKVFSRFSRASNGLIDAQVLLDPIYHTGNYKLWVYGNIQGENIHSISNYGLFSNQPNQSLYIDGKEWTKGDLLVLEEKYEEAIKQYEIELEENPNDIHILKTIAKIYSEEWDSNDEISNVDNKKALNYLLRLDKLVESDSVKSAIADYYYKEKDYNNAISYKIETKYNKHDIGDCYLYMNDYDKALEFYKQSLETYANDECISKIININLLRNNIDEINKYSNRFKNHDFIADYSSVTKDYMKIDRKSYEKFYMYIDQGEINEAKEWLEHRDDDLSRLYKSIFITFTHDERQTKEDEFISLFSKVKNKSIKKYMEYSAKSNTSIHCFE